MKEINDDELQFVARHYAENSLDADSAWQRFSQQTAPPVPSEDGSPERRPLWATLTGAWAGRAGGTPRLSTATRRIAASVSIALIVSASVACGIWYVRQQAAPPLAPPASSLPPHPSSLKKPYRYLQPAGESIVLKYDNAPIDDVLSELSTYYGRQLALHSASATDRCISGEIEATSLEEVVEILEATLDVNIEILNQ